MNKSKIFADYGQKDVQKPTKLDWKKELPMLNKYIAESAAREPIRYDLPIIQDKINVT